MDIVKDILEKQQRELEKFKPILVEKHLECVFDLGYLMCSDPNDIDEQNLKNNANDYLSDLTRDNVQLLVNEIWQLPIERVEETVVAKLPEPKMILPRSRKIPEVNPMTKWQQFAQEKGITKTKKDKKVYDKILDKWVPTYGFKRNEAERQTEWVLEVPKNADPMEDQFQKKKDLRSEKVAKNEIQRMKNIARAKKVDIPRTGIFGQETGTSKELLTAAVIAKASTASVGKFQDKLSKDKPVRAKGVKELIPGQKRKPTHLVEEKSINLELVKSILGKKPKLNMDKALQIQKREDRIEREAAAEEGGDEKKKRKPKNNVKSRRIGQLKPKGGKGNRNPNKRSIGRKRR